MLKGKNDVEIKCIDLKARIYLALCMGWSVRVLTTSRPRLLNPLGFEGSWRNFGRIGDQSSL